MEKILEELKMKKNYYDQIILHVQKNLESAPKHGNLRVVSCKGVDEYYLCTEKGDTNGRYIPKKDRKIAYDIAQRDYDRKIITCAIAWSKWLDRVIQTSPKENLKDIYTKSKRRKPLLTPYELPDEEFIKQWESVQYKGKGFSEHDPEIITEKGERVRSKSEKMIADKLNRMEIPYRYEYPLKMQGMKIIYPDFVILDVPKRKEYILEHFGMMDNQEYCQNAIRKINTYIRNGMMPGEKVLFTYETSQRPIDMIVVQKLLERHCKQSNIL